MRIWSLHPRYLDRQGLTACWREALLAQAVLAGRTRGYRHHSQLERFRAQPDPLVAVGAYLLVVAEEATTRGYRFDTGRIDRPAPIAGGARPTPAGIDAALVPALDAPAGPSSASGADSADRVVSVASPPVPRIAVTEGQVEHEWGHLGAKLAARSPERAAAQRDAAPTVHPLFAVVPGPVEAWERV